MPATENMGILATKSAVGFMMFYTWVYTFITVYVTHQNWMVRFLETNRAKFDLCPDVRFIFLSAGVDHVVNYEMPLNAEAGNVGIFQLWLAGQKTCFKAACAK